MKLELTLKHELTGICLSFLLLDQPCGLGSRGRNPRGACRLGWCLIRVVFYFPGPTELHCSCSWAQGPGGPSHRRSLVILLFLNVPSSGRAPFVLTATREQRSHGPSRLLTSSVIDYFWAQGTLSALALQPVRMELLGQLERGLLSFHSQVHGVCSRDWKSSLKGK